MTQKNPTVVEVAKIEDDELDFYKIVQHGPEDFSFEVHTDQNYTGPKDHDWVMTECGGFKTADDARKAFANRFSSLSIADPYQRMLWMEIESLQRQIRALREGQVFTQEEEAKQPAPAEA